MFKCGKIQYFLNLINIIIFTACSDSRLKWETDKQCREFMNKLLEPIETYNPMEVDEKTNNF